MSLSMRNRFLALLVSGVVVASSAACSVDSSVAPALSGSAASTSRAPSDGIIIGNPGKGNKPTLGVGDSAEYTFTVNPTQSNTLQLGLHTLSIPANAVCGLATSGYGLDLWNATCAPETASLTITAKVHGSASGYPRVDFEPALRFNPQTTVVLAMFMKHATTTEAKNWRILYCPTQADKTCYDESIVDASLTTTADWHNNRLMRRIKHFSGYMVAE